MKDIVDKTEAILIAFDRTFLFFGLPLGQFVHRYLIFPLGHIFHLLFILQRVMLIISPQGLLNPNIEIFTLLSNFSPKSMSLLPPDGS
jgi:hypothetical protein